MARWLSNPEAVNITIPEAINEESVTWYEIHVRIKDVEWKVKRRYRAFLDLHETLVESGVDKESLPQKKLIGNRDPSFIMKRRRELESYLQSVFRFLQHSLPQNLAQFLLMTKYDQHFMLRELASHHYDLMASDNLMTEAELSPLELHSISQRMRTPCPPQDTEDKSYDFTNVADFACGLKCLKVTGSTEAIGTSNIIPNELSFDLVAFKSLSKLVLNNIECCPEKIEALGFLRKTLKHIEATNCGLKSIADMLLCDTHHLDKDACTMDKDPSEEFVKGGKHNYDQLEYLDLRGNYISKIDMAVNLAGKVRTLLLGGNTIAAIENLSDLPELSVLELSDNCIDNTDDLHTKLGQLTRLDLVNNKIRNLNGCTKLYSLHKLNVAGNKIHDLDSVIPVSALPNLDSLNLQGNHVTTVVDYRLKVFESFGKRCSDLCLDNEFPSQPEVDKVSVLMALRVAREGKSATSLFGNLPRRV
jgi:hypothetical protein